MAASRSVLVTRPQGQGDSLKVSLESAGHRAELLPLLEITGLEELSVASRSIILALDDYRHIIFISGNAVRHGMAAIEDYWPQLPVGLNWYAIGRSTAQRLRQWTSEVTTTGELMNSEALLALPELQALAGQSIVLVKGQGGREKLRETLLERGARVDELICYRRSCPRWPSGAVAAALRDWHIDTVFISSGEGLGNLLALLSPSETTNVCGMTMVVPSPRVAEMARVAGFEDIIVADNASDEAMLRALKVA